MKFASSLRQSKPKSSAFLLRYCSYTNRCTTFDKIMEKQIFVILFLTLKLSLFGQNSNFKDCYEIKYLDFFGLDQMEIVKWSQSELDELLKMDFANERRQSEIKTNFMIPMIVYQLKEYHPNCVKNIDSTYFNKISEIYLKIREIDSSEFLKKSITEKIDFICADFYFQVENIDYIPRMIYTLDNGPFFGVDIDEKIKMETVKVQETKFGMLYISKIDNKTILTCKDKNENVIWQKIIIGLSNRYLTELHFAENPIEYNSVATIVNMYSEGEAFTLYLKNDGNFICYFHSW